MRNQRSSAKPSPPHQQQTGLTDQENLSEMYQRLLRRAVETSPFRPNAEERARKKERQNIIDENAQ